MAHLMEYIGIPYEKKNCWDLVVHFYKQEFDLDLRHLYEGDIPSPMDRENLIFTHSGVFEPVTNPQHGDLVVLRFRGIASHIGVLIAGKMFLHTLEGTGSCLDTLVRYKKMVEGFYRHVEKK